MRTMSMRNREILALVRRQWQFCLCAAVYRECLARQAAVNFNGSATFADNNSTPLTGTLAIDTTTGVIDAFDCNIPNVTTGSPTSQGALFTLQQPLQPFPTLGRAVYHFSIIRRSVWQGTLPFNAFLPIPVAHYIRFLNFQETNFTPVTNTACSRTISRDPGTAQPCPPSSRSPGAFGSAPPSWPRWERLYASRSGSYGAAREHPPAMSISC